jgi:hypothetical protein
MDKLLGEWARGWDLVLSSPAAGSRLVIDESDHYWSGLSEEPIVVAVARQHLIHCLLGK